MSTKTMEQPYDGVNFDVLYAAGNGIYYGIYDHAAELSMGFFGNATDAERNKTPSFGI